MCLRWINIIFQYIRVAVAVPIWLATFGMQYGVVYGPHNAAVNQVMLQKVAPMVDSVSYGSLARIAWGLAIVVQVCRGWVLQLRTKFSKQLVHKIR